MPDDRTDDDLVQRVRGDNVTWVEIASVGVEDEARLVTGFLDAEGIPAQIENMKFTEAPTTFGSMGDIRIYVAVEDEQRALALLKQRNDEFETLDVDGETVVTDEGAASIADDAETAKDNE
jgi:Putative prokaryotic signal transducing protein